MLLPAHKKLAHSNGIATQAQYSLLARRTRSKDRTLPRRRPEKNRGKHTTVTVSAAEKGEEAPKNQLDVRAVLFDMDGVLCNSKDLSRRYHNCHILPLLLQTALSLES